jgi:ribA/ribD-fused uncharacterized protein
MIYIRRNKDPYGWMGNMSRYPVTHEGRQFLTTEALFQALRFDWETQLEIVEAIRAERSPMGAKFKAKKHADDMVVEMLSEKDLDNMRLCLRLKTGQHPELVEMLLDTKDEGIAEDCTKRRNKGSALFWGVAIEDDGSHTGDNWLGRLWMDLRTELREIL